MVMRSVVTINLLCWRAASVISVTTMFKGDITVGAKLIVLGGPSMNIGLGGGAASRWILVNLMQILILPRYSEITRKWNDAAKKLLTVAGNVVKKNPILFIHDVGAGDFRMPCQSWFQTVDGADALISVKF